MVAPFPDLPSDRRAVVVLEQHEIDRCSRLGETQLLTAPQTHVLVHPIMPQQGSVAIANIVAAQLDRPGTILVQSPFEPDIYADASEAVEQFALTKHMLFSNFCQALGAEKVSVTQIDTILDRKSQSIKLEGRKSLVKGELSVGESSSDILESSLSLVDHYGGGSPDLDKAEDFLRAYRLLSDSNMRSLLQARKNSDNPIKKRNLTLDLSTEANKSMQVVGKLKLPTVAFSADYKNAVSSERKYVLTMEVVFPE